MNDNIDKGSRHSETQLSLIQAHFKRIARRLEAEGAAARSFDHGTNRGQIREAFIREFLSQNTSPMTGIGTGEIIHAGTNASDQRNQIDVVIHNNRYPKISLATGVDLFLGETVSSFIEIKSKLEKSHVRKAAKTVKSIKEKLTWAPQKLNPTGLVKNPRPYSFIFAYDGPSQIKTILNWMKLISADDEYNLSQLIDTPPENRSYFKHYFIDGIFILGKGYVVLDALPFESVLNSPELKGMALSTDHIWVYGEENELAFLWMLINVLSEKYLWNNIDLTEYLGAIGRYVSD